MAYQILINWHIPIQAYTVMAERTPTDQYGYATPAQSVDLGQVTVLGYQIPPWSNLGASSTESGNTASITDYLGAEFIRNGRLSMTPAREITETTSATEHYEGQGFVVSGSYATLSNVSPVPVRCDGGRVWAGHSVVDGLGSAHNYHGCLAADTIGTAATATLGPV